MSAQFSTFDTKEDRRELIILFQKLGSDEVRARWLEALIGDSVTGFGRCPVQIDAVQCSAVGAYLLFVQIVGVLGVSIREAAVKLDRSVREA